MRTVHATLYVIQNKNLEIIVQLRCTSGILVLSYAEISVAAVSP